MKARSGAFSKDVADGGWLSLVVVVASLLDRVERNRER